jgi:hypothetical protein
MPPSYTKLKIVGELDGAKAVDLRADGINFIYIPDFLDPDTASQMFSEIEESGVLQSHNYIGPFGRHTRPHRLTYATVPKGRRYRYKGGDLEPRESETFNNVIRRLTSALPSAITEAPDATISNGYRYNNDDYIAPHVDDEKFMKKDNSEYWHDSTVCTVTLLRDPKAPMGYHLANPDTGVGYKIFPAHGSLIIQGSVLHEVIRKSSSIPDKVSRISVTLRKIIDSCPHGPSCNKISCPTNKGPSNYIYYSNAIAPIIPVRPLPIVPVPIVPVPIRPVRPISIVPVRPVPVRPKSS